jgi:azurin
MKLHTLIATALVAFLAVGCAKKEESKAAAAAPAAAAGPRVIELTGDDTMKFNVTSIDLKAGEEVKITMTNTGTMPKQAMAHDLVILKPGTDAAAFATAAAPTAMKGELPESLESQVVAHTKMLGPKESDTLTLKLTTPGVYPYLCTFPGHYQVGMHGTITVK